MSKISNVMTFLQLLSNGKKYSIKELSQILEVTPRMVRVYKEELEKAGIYIDTLMGPYGGYVLKKEIYLPNRSFIKEDFEILDIVLSKTKNAEEIEKIRNLKIKLGIFI